MRIVNTAGETEFERTLASFGSAKSHNRRRRRPDPG